MPDPFLCVRGLGKTYTHRTWWGATRDSRTALRDVSFSLAQGSTLGLVGASGSGKSTLARCLALFDAPTCGEILLEGCNLLTASPSEQRRLRTLVQLIFQQPASSLNPRFTAAQIVEEPLVIQRSGTARERRDKACELMELVGLRREAIGKRPLEFSGGERQRLAIARALTLAPKLLILDEAFSGLDVSIQRQVSNLLADLQKRLALTCILISHDLGAVADLATEIAVMDEGSIVEQASTADLFAHPSHSRSKELIEASHALRFEAEP